jgi:inosine-uridine nucleoside N-ribohydrolase
MAEQLDVIFDMETSDPDDFLTLLLLADHPRVSLKGVTLVPGCPQQVGLVRFALHEWFGKDIPIGARTSGHSKACVSEWHYNAYGNISPSDDVRSAADVLRELCDVGTTLISGAPLTNVAQAIRAAESDGERFSVGRLVVQGGFAGEGVVPAEKQLDKFRGRTTCPTHNLMGDKKAAELVTAYTAIPDKRFVSKNVCHRVVYDGAMHERFTAVKAHRRSLERIWHGMDTYLQKHPGGKMFHDPLAACCAIDPTIGEWAEVELFREGAEWGSRLSPGSGTWVITDYDPVKFLDVLFCV